jgi:hypothetical protein
MGASPTSANLCSDRLSGLAYWRRELPGFAPSPAGAAGKEIVHTKKIESKRSLTP